LPKLHKTVCIFAYKFTYNTYNFMFLKNKDASGKT